MLHTLDWLWALIAAQHTLQHDFIMLVIMYGVFSIACVLGYALNRCEERKDK